MFQKTITIENSRTCRENLLAIYHATTDNRLAARIAEIDGSYPFRGAVTGEQFSLRPIVEHHSIFLPVIRGDVCEKDGGTLITAKLSLKRSVLLLLWLMTALCIAVGLAVALYRPVLSFLPFLLLIVLWGIAAICFKTERRDAEKRLRAVFGEEA